MRGTRRFRFFMFVSMLIVCTTLLAAPASSFTAQSLTITVDKTGNGTAVFRYALEGFVENAIPESMLREELAKGLATSDEPPEVTAFDKSGATLVIKQFAQLRDTDTGTEYLTSSLNFSGAEEALKKSAVSSLITADFTPASTKVIFPDGYQQSYTDSAILPSIRHLVVDPAKQGGGTKSTTAAARTTSPVTAKIRTPVSTPTPSSTEGSFTLLLITAVIVFMAVAGGGAYWYQTRMKK